LLEGQPQMPILPEGLTDRLKVSRRQLPATWLRSALQLLRLYWLQDPVSALFKIFHAALLPLLVFYFALRIAPGRGEVLTLLFAGGMAAGAGIGVITFVGFSMLADVQLGRLALLRALGVAKMAYFSAQILNGLGLSFLSSVFCLALLHIVGSARIDAQQISVAAFAALATGAAGGGLAAFIALTAPDYASGRDRLMLASAGLAFISPVFYKTNDLPLPLSVLAWASPFTHAAELNRAVLSGAAPPVAYLAAALLLAAALNVAAFRVLVWR
jgi:putative exporter of polyketide antibiotics